MSIPWSCRACGALDTGTIPRAYPNSPICAWCQADHRSAGLRWCNAGRHAVPLANFSPKGKRCRACQSTANAAWRLANRDQSIAASHAYWVENKARLNLLQQQYYKAHRATILARKKAYYQAHRDRILGVVRDYRTRIPARSILRMLGRQAIMRRAPGHGRARWIAAKVNAYRKGQAGRGAT